VLLGFIVGFMFVNTVNQRAAARMSTAAVVAPPDIDCRRVRTVRRMKAARQLLRLP
jgi:hypothetical protein